MFDPYVVCILLILLLLVLLRVQATLKPVSKPEFKLRQIGRNTMPDVLTYSVTVGPVVDKDVVTRRLTVNVDGTDTGTTDFPGTATDLGLVSAVQNSKVVLTLVDIDDAGNKSEPATVSFTAEDTLPPAQPGKLGVTLVSESSTADVPPVVTPDVPPAVPPAVTPDVPPTV